MCWDQKWAQHWRQGPLEIEGPHTALLLPKAATSGQLCEPLAGSRLPWAGLTCPGKIGKGSWVGFK